MRTLFKLTLVELKLFFREPLTVVFTLALPLILLFVLGEVFGNVSDPHGQLYQGVGPMDFYAPAYVGLVIASIGVVGLPVHLAGYRERGVLRRLRASSISAWRILGSQVLVSFVIAAAGTALTMAVTSFGYDARLPHNPWLVAVTLVLSTLSFATLGVLLGALLPTARVAQLVGLLLFFLMMFLGGSGPPPEVLSGTLKDVAAVMPLTHVVKLVQGPWLDLGWKWAEFGIVSGILVVSATLAVRFFRWE